MKSKRLESKFSKRIALGLCSALLCMVVPSSGSISQSIIFGVNNSIGSVEAISPTSYQSVHWEDTTFPTRNYGLPGNIVEIRGGYASSDFSQRVQDARPIPELPLETMSGYGF